MFVGLLPQQFFQQIRHNQHLRGGDAADAHVLWDNAAGRDGTVAARHVACIG